MSRTQFTRRRIALFSISMIVGSAGCLANGEPSSETKSAIKWYNAGIESYEEATATASDASEKADKEQFNQAAQLYGDAQQSYDWAMNQFASAWESAAECDRLQSAASEMNNLSRTAARETNAYVLAYNRYADDETEEGDEFLSQAQDISQERKEYSVTPKFEPDELNC
jgi:hypothetical protein